MVIVARHFFPTLMPTHSDNPRCVALLEPGVAKILLPRSLPKVVNSVVCFDSITVVNFDGPRVMNPKPSKAVEKVHLLIENDREVPPVMLRSCDTTHTSLASIDAPSENARLKIVVKQLAKLLRRERILASHAASFRQRWGVIRAATVF